MLQNFIFELGKKYKVYLADGTVIVFVFLGGEPPMVAIQGGSTVPLHSLPPFVRVEECEE